MITGIKWISVGLILLGVLGFLTVADDLRPKGELLGVGAVLFTGILGLTVFFIIIRRKKRRY